MRGLVIGAAFLVLAFGVVGSARSRIVSTDGEIRGEVLKLADAIEKGDDATQGHADAIAKKTELEDVMDLFRLRARRASALATSRARSLPTALKP